jgi:hypothetical protein
MDNFTPVSAVVVGAAISNLSGEILVFVSAMIAGGLFAKIVSPAGSGA